MKSGPKLKGRQVEAPHGKRSLNQPDVLNVRQKGRAEAPTQGMTRNQPNTSTATGKHAKIGVGVAHTYFGNSRDAVHHKFSVKGKHD